jgi:hypothetical protein
VFDNILTYNKSIKKHNFDVMVGSSWTGSKWSQSYINGSHYMNGDIQTLNAANKISWNGTGTSASEWAIMSFVGRLAYNYDSKYLLTVNMRSDGSSKLHPDHRWGTFPSVSAAWRISSEEFMKDYSPCCRNRRKSSPSVIWVQFRRTVTTHIDCKQVFAIIVVSQTSYKRHNSPFGS